MGIELVLLALLGGGAAIGALAALESDAEEGAITPVPDTASEVGPADGAMALTTTAHSAYHADNLWVGTDQADDVSLSDGADLGLGGLGDDVIAGGAGEDRLLGEGGRDTLFGGDGQDVLMDGQHDRTGLDGPSFQLWINALQAEAPSDPDHDVFEGGAGDDVIHSMHGEDLAYGGAGNDLILAQDTGADGADGLYGGSGDDRLVGDGHDVMIGGAGADLFEADFSGNGIETGREGRITILDFDPQQDRIILYDEKAEAPAFDLEGPRDQDLTPRTGHIAASEDEGFIRLDLVHLDGSVSELAQLRFQTLSAVEDAIAAGNISAVAL